MAAPVWLLSVDLQAKTASFTTGLADAARKARSSFGEVTTGSVDMGERTAESFGSVRSSIGLLDNAIRGAHAQAMADVVRMFARTQAVMNLLPFAAAIGGIMLFASMAVEAGRKIAEWREEQARLGNDMLTFGTTVQETFNGLDDKLLQAGIKADDLAGNHLAALDKQLKLIDHESMSDLMHAFESIAKASDSTFKDLQTKWYQFGEGSDGAKHALDDFTVHYNALLAAGQNEKASGLLHGTLAQARQVLDLLQHREIDANTNKWVGGGTGPTSIERAAQSERELAALKIKTGANLDKQIAAQQQLVNVLNDQVQAETTIGAIRAADRGNANTEYHNARQQDASKNAQALMREDDKASRGFASNFKQYENMRIEATQTGSMERVQALRVAMEETRELFGEESALYQEYAAAEVKAYNDAADKTLEAVAKELDKESELRKQALQDQVRELDRAAQELAKHKAAMLQASQNGQPMDMARVAMQRQEMELEYQIKRAVLEKELRLYQQAGQQRIREAQQTQAQIDLLDKRHTDMQKELLAQQRQDTRATLAQIGDDYANMFMSVMRGHETMYQALQQATDSLVNNMLAATIQVIAGNKSEQLSSAKAAAAAAWKAMSGIPVIGPELGAVAAATTFAGAMAFEKGTDYVHGSGLRGDHVPALLSDGEGVVPGGVMDGLRQMARNGGFQQQRPSTTIHIRPTYHVQTIDGDGMQAALEKHTDQLQRHFEQVVRKMNR